MAKLVSDGKTRFSVPAASVEDMLDMPGEWVDDKAYKFQKSFKLNAFYKTRGMTVWVSKDDVLQF